MMMENLLVFGTPALPFPLEWWTSQVRDALVIEAVYAFSPEA